MEQSHYSVTYDDLETDGGPSVESETYIMPILYVVWPVDKPLPCELDYEIDYEVYLPPYESDMTRSISSHSELSRSALQILEDEAISLALGIDVPARIETRGVVRTLTGTVYQYDTTAAKNVGVPNLRIRFQLGTNIYETYTQSNGYFSITNDIPATATFNFVHQQVKWKITPENSTTPIVESMGTVGSNNNITAVYYLQLPTLEIHRAVNYYMSGVHGLTVCYYASGGIRIRALSYSSGTTTTGYFSYSENNDPSYITIYNMNRGSTARVCGTVLHELGHWIMWHKKSGNYKRYKNTHKFIRESWASYAGWHMGYLYYSKLGWLPKSIDEDITGQSRQEWQKTLSTQLAFYSPLFVDLSDDYNQYTTYTLYNSDPISKVPVSVIMEIANEPLTWADCRSKIQSYVGVYYTSAQFNTFIAPYDYWFKYINL